MSPDTMQPEANYERDILKRSQAVNEDYCNTGYDRGHLNPNSFQCEDGRKATFTLSNSAPMDACFNRVDWKRWEEAVRYILTAASQGTAYIVTGTVPSGNYRIPRQGEFDPPSSRDFNRVTAPSHVWSAVCFKSNVEKQSFSFGYIGLNQADSKINVKTVPQLNRELSLLYHSNHVQVFADDCYSSKPKSEDVTQHLYRRIQLPLSDKLTMSEETLNLFHTAMTQFDDVQVAVKMPRLTAATIEGVFFSAVSWFANMQTMKYVTRSACVLSQPYTGPVWGQTNTKIKKRDIPDGDGSQELVCSLVPEVEEGCTSSCLFKEEARGYRCYYYSSERPCSPQYSIITVSGAKCRSDHTCGTHGQQYYWCYTGEDSWEYCSPPLPMGITQRWKYCRSNHNCGWYGESYTWCYTDYNDNWDYCCSMEYNFSALNGKMCKSDHLCDYHGERYLWCYTTDGSWEYCCTR
ncbi:uncharacterized protein LOC134457718 [Engraulis encrasicolus]|uniref:uncharacterized protein LOC134457718 n=1 Tax=Engraulis encrasicolus TaxID=184585 RepID=UPI002FD5D91B